MTTIRQLLDRKGPKVYSIGPDATVYEAVRAMADHDVGALLVLDGDALAGIVSERDYARKVILRDRSSRETLVRDIMTAGVVTITPECDVQEGLSVMTERRIRHLPVVEEGQVAGMVSIGDLVKAVIREQQSTIQQLENYISS